MEVDLGELRVLVPHPIDKRGFVRFDLPLIPIPADRAVEEVVPLWQKVLRHCSGVVDSQDPVGGHHRDHAGEGLLVQRGVVRCVEEHEVGEPTIQIVGRELGLRSRPEDEPRIVTEVCTRSFLTGRIEAERIEPRIRIERPQEIERAGAAEETDPDAVVTRTTRTKPCRKSTSSRWMGPSAVSL